MTFKPHEGMEKEERRKWETGKEKGRNNTRHTDCVVIKTAKVGACFGEQVRTAVRLMNEDIKYGMSAQGYIRSTGRQRWR